MENGDGRRAYACTCPASPAWSLSPMDLIILSTWMEWRGVLRRKEEPSLFIHQERGKRDGGGVECFGAGNH